MACPAARAAWILLAAGCAAFGLGDLYTYNYERFTGHEVPFPSLGDAAYVAMYPLMMGGLLLLVVGAYVAWYGAWELRVLGGSDPADPVIEAAARIQRTLADWVRALAP